MQFEGQFLFENCLKNGINLFVGAGFSILSKNKDNLDIPIGNKLTSELKQEFGINGDFNLPQISTILENTRRSEFYTYLRKRFKIGEYDQKYKVIESLNIKSIFTTNIDDLILNIFEDSKIKYINDVSHNGESNDKTAVNYSALHGCINYEDRKLVFDVSSLNNTYSNNPRIWDYLSHALEKLPTLFWGYSLADSGVIQALTSNRTIRDVQKDIWIILRKEEESFSEYYRSIGFKIIISDTEEFLNYLNSLKILQPDNYRVPDITKEIDYYFSKNIVPRSDKGLSVRPISHFFAGNPPIWSDIFSSQIYKTSYFSLIQNNILANKNNIILGSPVSGKTTLMMQLAANINFSDGFKFVFNNLNEHKATLLINILKVKKALIFIDNFSDSIDAFNMLAKIKNFVVVGFERGHNYGIISHLVDEDLFIFTNITKLTDQDIQGIYDKLPLDQRKPKLVRETNRNYDKDSIFEFISRNVKYPTIEKRYEQVLFELEEKDSLLAELLVLSSYVHRTRTPLSFDMIFSYFNEDIGSYRDIYIMIDDLKDLIKNYSGDLMIDENQDYYYPRSIYIAETVLKVADRDLLKAVIKRALHNIPSTQIPHYNIYRKSAFDKNLILRAFSDWREGKEFYEDAYKFDFNNPYVLQQGALYLSQMKKYNDAFYWIDKAITQSNNKYFSIRNSHAIILFEANINSKEENSDIRNQLDYSESV